MSASAKNEDFLFPLCFVIYEVASYMANDAYVPGLIDLSKSLNISPSGAYLTLTVFFLGNLLFQLIIGPCAERFGRRKVLLVGACVFIGSSLICAFTTNFYIFLLARFIQGSCLPSLTITGYATIHSMFDRVHAVKTLAWMSCITILAPSVGPLFGAIILLFAHWQWIFIILAIWVLIILIPLYRCMPETIGNQREDFSIASLVNHYSCLLFDWVFMKPVISLGLLFAAMTAWMVAGNFIIVIDFHQTPMCFGIVQFIIFMGFFVGTQLASSWIEHFSLRTINSIIIMLVALSSSFSLVSALLFDKSLVCLIIPLLLLTIAAGIALPLYNRLIVESSPEPMGFKISLFTFFTVAGCLLGSVLINIFYSNLTHFYIIFSLLGVLFVTINGFSYQKSSLESREIDG
ncbi:multidrug efflux system protein [Legionella birminghamensis]|uniref:Multidrug efflux system protein n=1 Tax=Legionella birminghamensis TaxID=28083 RepID=A0A378I8Y9_9GAMM|nr:MFS transporter [Legionella birminghamensis]KTC74690.1 multidrug efflux system protein [Legionella birminghamensis]STX31493.1 multidrug efflux system protein [Legionella birminghamensis]